MTWATLTKSDATLATPEVLDMMNLHSKFKPRAQKQQQNKPQQRPTTATTKKKPLPVAQTVTPPRLKTAPTSGRPGKPDKNKKKSNRKPKFTTTI
jgi:hypothetical protein